jgi:hypothetical protein
MVSRQYFYQDFSVLLLTKLEHQKERPNMRLAFEKRNTACLVSTTGID